VAGACEVFFQAKNLTKTHKNSHLAKGFPFFPFGWVLLSTLNSQPSTNLNVPGSPVPDFFPEKAQQNPTNLNKPQHTYMRHSHQPGDLW
jgi:hypothetical protein